MWRLSRVAEADGADDDEPLMLGYNTAGSIRIHVWMALGLAAGLALGLAAALVIAALEGEKLE
jgi:hypothetical protein